MSVNCLKLIDDANNGRLNDETLEQIIKDLQDVKTKRKAESGLSAVEDDIFERGAYLIKEAELAKKLERRNRYKNILVEQKIFDLANKADELVEDPSLALEALLVGVNSPFEGAQRSVDSLINSIGGEIFGGFISNLNRKNLLTKFNKMNKDFELQVTRALGNLNTKNPKTDAEAKVTSKDAKAIAKIMFKYQRSALKRENQAGAYIRLKEGRVVRTSHDPGKMTALGKQGWVDYMMETDRLNWAKTANGDLVNADDALKRAFLARSYEAITTGVRIATDRTEVGRAFTGPKNIAKARSESAVFTFKDPDEWYEYNQSFGRGSLRESFVQDLQSSIRSTALMEQLGTNPEAMFERVQARL